MEESKMVLRTEDLVKKYGKRTVVSHVSINVKQGEIVGLLGPNGAGKTTSFYMTVGLITPNEGRIFLDDLGDYQISGLQTGTNGNRIPCTGSLRIPPDECGRQYRCCARNDQQAQRVSKGKARKSDSRIPSAKGTQKKG